MNRKFKITGIIILLILIGTIVFYNLYSDDKQEMRNELIGNDYVINFEKQGLKIFISAKTWGIAGNHERIMVSLSPFHSHEKNFENESLIFYTPQIYYKKQGVDSLMIYVASSAVSKKTKDLKSSIKIIKVELDSYDKIKDYELNYKKYGLLKASIYTK